MAELVPAPLNALVRRAFAERAAQGAIYDLPEKAWWRPPEDLDLSATFHGDRASNPVGPAAGPHSQLAQNIVLSWLAGARVMELKTVQINDRLEIPRPCIDVHTVGYNVEWSQELRIEQSLREYAKAWLLIRLLAKADVLGIGAERAQREAQGTLFDLSVGYDLAGIRGDAVTGFIRGAMDVSELIEELRAELPAELGALRDVPVPAQMADCITLSTFHGCPPDEIESIVRYLLQDIGIHVVIKMNPPLLGHAAVDRMVRQELGYSDVVVPEEAFAEDMQWDDMVPMVTRLRVLAQERDLTLGVKFTNTLIVKNHRDFFTTDDMYLSGQPLHVVASHILARFRGVFPEIPVSFSAGVDQKNFTDCVALGLVPITTCTDLLRPGGYARLPKYLKALEKRMRALGTADLPAYVSAVGLDAAQYAAGLLGDVRYNVAKNSKAPKKIGSDLTLFDCVNCDKCVPVCPNDANFVYDLQPEELRGQELVWQDGVAQVRSTPPVVIETGHQLANFADFCNECGNCDVFCPEDGGPFVMKPRFFGSQLEWARWTGYDGLALSGEGEGKVRVWGRYDLRPYELLIDDEAGSIWVCDGTAEAWLDAASYDLRSAGDAPDGHRLDLTAVAILAVLTRAVLDPARPNPMNALLLAIPA